MSRKLTPREDRVEINHQFSSLDHFIKEYVSNISRSGVFVRSKDPLPVGTRVNLRFTVVSEELEVIEGVGEVCRVSQRPKGMGVLFVELTNHSEKLINKLIVRRITGGHTLQDDAPTTVAPAPRRTRAQTIPPPPPQPSARRTRQQTLPPPPPKPRTKK